MARPGSRDDGEALADTDTDRGQAPPFVALPQHLRQRADDPSAGRTERVTDGDGTATSVNDLGVDLPGVEAGERLHGERLVELD
jgi:hypothetical protein